MRDDPNYKPDHIFSKYLGMAVAAERTAIAHFRQYGHDFGYFDKGAGSDAIFRDPALKGRRKADLRCIKCGQRLEVRSKSRLMIAMSDSQTRRFDDPQNELSESDWVTIVKLRSVESGDPTQAQWEIDSPFYTVSVADLACTKDLTIGSNRKPMSMGSEIFIEWPTALCRATGTVVEVNRKTRTVMIEQDNGALVRVPLSLRNNPPIYSYVKTGDHVIAGNNLLAGVVRLVNRQNLICTGTQQAGVLD